MNVCLTKKGEFRAEQGEFARLAVRARAIHSEAWEVTELARTGNVQQLGRAVTELTIVVGALLGELERHAENCAK